MAGNPPLPLHVAAELEARSDRNPNGIAAILKQIGEQVIVYQVPLHHQAEMPGDIERYPAADAVECGPFFLLPEIAGFLAVDDVLIDSMRGKSSTWTRIRVNLRHVPEDLRPSQETPDPDDDPTRERREWNRKTGTRKKE